MACVRTRWAYLEDGAMDGLVLVGTDRLLLYGGRSETAHVLSTSYELQLL